MKKIICIGDSNTYGYDPRSYFGSRYPDSVRWTDRLNADAVINLGINGMTVPSNHSAYVNLISKENPDLITVMLGTNDLLQGVDPARIADRMNDFLTSISKLHKRILLIAPPTLQYGEWVQSNDLIENSRNLAVLYRDLADGKGCLFADAGEWKDSVFTGIVEQSGRDHIILSDPQTGNWYLLLMIYVNFIKFDEPINTVGQFYPSKR